MCELMGLSFAQPISADFSIRAFAARDEENADGWGLAWYPDQSVALVKEPIRWQASTYTGFLENYTRLQSRIYIAHVRHKTSGGPTYADTHPFVRELHGREFCFAHNGTLTGGFWQLAVRRFRPVGQTDSEHLFCHLLDSFVETSDPLGSDESWKFLHARFREVNQFGRLNCMLSDGKRLICYHDMNGFKGLTYRKVPIRDHAVRRFEDETVRIALDSEAVNYGIVVATRPLSTQDWHALHAGEMIVLEDGLVRFPTNRPTRPVQPPSPNGEAETKDVGRIFNPAE